VIRLTTAELNIKCRELSVRDSDGIFVGLFVDVSDPVNPEVFVQYEDYRTGESFTLNPPPNRALEAFNHPNVFANSALMSGR
jgi:hypothetical protein